ncbi:hemolysin activation/secretion protein [Povalibacter uvarum]|uniref:Hemolysin activation/secretion protein n=1 Tax=Povalibacter uvarum TaxID=732238 RepID=A0A841HKR6_9GAMM|nr:BamA/TamA family outer membrane protein [Povalibacter uvarum]MBB6093446.1 hemolysin activation/secretion protein [Povalibacter uvarum]
MRGFAALVVVCAGACCGSYARAEENTAAEGEGEPAAAATQPPPTLEALEAQGATIGRIIIVNEDVFDTNLPEENNWLFRLANKFHIETRPDIIKEQLLVRSGDPLSARRVRESERILRTNDYLFDARITPVPSQDGTVDLVVRTRDVWTLKPGISFGRSGGENSTGIEFEESNLLGRGKEIELAFTRDVDRDIKRIRYQDPHLLGSWNRMQLAYEDNSDGRLRDFSFDRPFYSMETSWSAGAGAADWDRIDSRYDLGEVVDRYRHIEEDVSAFGGWSTGVSNGWVRRTVLGASYESDRFYSIEDDQAASVLPEDRVLAYPFVQVTLLEDAFEERRNQDQIERTEDLYTGTFWRGRIGYASTQLGSDRDAWMLATSAGASIERGENNKHTTVFALSGESRIEDGDLRNGVLTALARYYWRTSPRQLFFASLSGTVTESLDADRQLLLGGDNGLRGYPLRYQGGSSRALLTLEHRVYTKYYLFRLFHLGGAVFFDAGRTWGKGAVPGVNQGLLKDVGVGLRLGSSRSSFGNVIHLDLAFPLDGDNTIDDMQFLVETKKSF